MIVELHDRLDCLGFLLEGLGKTGRFQLGQSMLAHDLTEVPT
jgi:hypothetical protein